MSIKDKLREIFNGEPEKPTEDYWRRNVGKKLPVTILMPTEQEIKQKENENPNS